jgi:hypothetical protein
VDPDSDTDLGRPSWPLKQERIISLKKAVLFNKKKSAVLGFKKPVL